MSQMRQNSRRLDDKTQVLHGGHIMNSEDEKQWEVLCEQASKEQDSGKLMVLIGKLNRALAEKCAPRPRLRSSD
jgi:hypothetical protein